MPGRVGPCGELAFHRCPGEHLRVGDEAVYRLHHAHRGRRQPVALGGSAGAVAHGLKVFKGVEVPVGDLVQNVGDVPHPHVNLVDGPAYVGEYADVAANDPLRIVVHSHSLQGRIRLHEAAQTLDALVQAVFEVVKIALVRVGDLEGIVPLPMLFTYRAAILKGPVTASRVSFTPWMIFLKSP